MLLNRGFGALATLLAFASDCNTEFHDLKAIRVKTRRKPVTESKLLTGYYFTYTIFKEFMALPNNEMI